MRERAKIMRLLHKIYMAALGNNGRSGRGDVGRNEMKRKQNAKIMFVASEILHDDCMIAGDLLLQLAHKLSKRKIEKIEIA